MNTIERIADQVLVEKIKYLIKNERAYTLQILEYLQAINKRRLYAEYGCGSLFEFCMYLGYSDTSYYAP
ncbi:MAG: hypothetical protein HQK51_05910 [Oligoflexia bacterium]|nr:hypothetical protein [Oligoflexia bacterium]